MDIQEKMESAPKSEQELRGVLVDTANKIEEIIRNEDKISEKEKGLSLDSNYLDIQSPYFQSGRFSFWAGLNKDPFTESSRNGYSAVIKNLRIPQELRNQGLGKKIVEAWEDSLKNHGVDIFAATNIKDQPAIEFWKKLGYQIPKSETYKKVPYYMVKKIS